MDVMRPLLECINGCYYRINNPQHFNRNISDIPYIENDEYEDEIVSPCDRDYDICTAEEDQIEKLPNNKLKLEMRCPRVLRRTVIGIKGQTRKRLEYETKTEIWVPKTQDDGNITIVGLSETAVKNAQRKIKELVSAARRREKFTHFLGIAANQSDIKIKFNMFKNEVMERCGCERGINEHLFQIPEKLHLTIAVLTLLDNFERNFALTTMHDCELRIKEITKNKPIKVRIQGIQYMNDDPTEVNVLYGKVVDRNEILQKVVNEVACFFALRELLDDDQEIKLHVTLMNTSFLPNVELNDGQRGKRSLTFDAKKLLQYFMNYDFGELVVDRILICQRFTTSANGFYNTSGFLKLGI